MTAHKQTSLHVYIVCMCTSWSVCVATTSCCGEHFLSVGVDLRDQLMRNLPLEGLLDKSYCVSLQVSGKRNLSLSALWRVGLPGTYIERVDPGYTLSTVHVLKTGNVLSENGNYFGC